MHAFRRCRRHPRVLERTLINALACLQLALARILPQRLARHEEQTHYRKKKQLRRLGDRIDLDLKSLPFVKAVDNLEQVTGLRVASRAEHLLQALG